MIVSCVGVWLQSKLKNQVDHLVLGYYVVVVCIESLEYIAAKVKTLFMQQALGQGDKLTPGYYAVIINIKDIK